MRKALKEHLYELKTCLAAPTIKLTGDNKTGQLGVFDAEEACINFNS